MLILHESHTVLVSVVWIVTIAIPTFLQWLGSHNKLCFQHLEENTHTLLMWQAMHTQSFHKLMNELNIPAQAEAQPHSCREAADEGNTL